MLNFVLAILPILSVILLLFVFKKTSLFAGVASLLVACAISLFSSQYHLEVLQIVDASIRGFLISFIAAYVLFFGIFLFHLMKNVGAIQQIASFISHSTHDHILQVILLVIGFSPIIESTSGFGIAFMVVAPILAALGFPAYQATLIGLVSLLAVPWGALATGTVIGANLGGIPLQALGIGSGILSIPVFLYFLTVAVFIAGGWQAIKAKWLHMLGLSIVFTLSILIFSAYVSVELAGVFSALLTTGLGFVMIRYIGHKKADGESATLTSAAVDGPTHQSILKVMSPYIILTLLILITRLVPGVSIFLKSHVVLDLPKYSYTLPLLYSPGFWLLVTCLITILMFQIDQKTIATSLKTTISQWIPFTITTTAFVSISEVMSSAGMIHFLSSTAGAVLGSSFIIISAIIGGLGGFLTGSNTGANAMFIKLQMQTAQHLGLNPELFAYLQNTSASHATMASPSRILLGTSLFKIQSEENRILKSISIVVLGALLLIVLVASIWLWLAGW